jgi:hypothetical protein
MVPESTGSVTLDVGRKEKKSAYIKPKFHLAINVLDLIKVSKANRRREEARDISS